MKKILYSIFLLVIAFGIVYGAYVFLNDEEKHETSIDDTYINNGLEILGYDEAFIESVRDNFTDEEIKKHLLDKKYDSLIDYKSSKIFNIENLDRYVSYDEKTEYNKKDVVKYVEIGLDKEFYTDIKEITNYDNILVLVNKYNKLPSNYSATDLVTLSSSYSNSSQKMKTIAAEAMKKMIDDGKTAGVNMIVISGYRTETLQNTLFNNSTKKNGLDHALMYSAKPGHSEHQTGFSADINTCTESFKDTMEYKWLSEQAYKYGFIERYPKGKEFITGYGFEPWHYRYVGVEVATIIHENDISLEEYFVLYK